MFDTFILQQRNKLVKCQIGDLPSPEALHTVYVQRFKSKCIKPLAEVGSEFPVPVKALPADLAIQPRQLAHGTPPVIRTFFLTRKETFIELAELFQGLLQELWRLYLFACAKCQICVLHSKLCQWHNLSLLYIVCPNALTRSGQRFGRSIVCCDTKPIVSTIITFYRDLLNIAKPITVFVKCERDSFEVPLTFQLTPFTEGDSDTIIFYLPTRLTREGDRLEFVLGFDTRSATMFVEKSFVSCVYTFSTHTESLGLANYSNAGVSSFSTRSNEHTSHDSSHTTVPLYSVDAATRGNTYALHAYRQACCPSVYSSGVCVSDIYRFAFDFTRITPLTPVQWVGRHTIKRFC